ncbi:hypothetical protein CsSME_00022372 [Camellia sinensis var. sinensis]
MAEYCVTGASYTVRTTVRDPENVEKVGFLWELSGAKERLKIFKAGLMVEGSFDKAIEGVDGVFHTAAPLLISYDHNDQANIEDTLNVLSSCTKASSVRRVVLTSSCSAIRYRDDVQQVSPLNESHWSELEYYCKRYNAEESGIDLVVVNPSLVVGPLLAPQPTSLRGEYQNTTIGFVHIDDVIAAHILAMEDSEASGRLICSSSVAHWSDIIDMLRSKYPTYPFDNKCSSQKGDNNPHSMNSNKIIKLGLPPLKTIDQMFDDCIKSFQDKGFL